MTLDSQYARMILPMPVRVWGRLLHPVTVGHYALLSRVGASVVGGDGLPGSGDLALILWVLSRPWEKAVKQLGSFRQILSCRLMAWLFRKDPKLQKRVLIEFLRFWQFQNETWEIWKNEEGNSEDGNSLAMLQKLRWILMSEWGYTHQEVMDSPWKLAVSDAFGCLAIKEKVRIVSPQDKTRHELIMEHLRGAHAG